MTDQDYPKWLAEMHKLDQAIIDRQQENTDVLANDAKYMADYIASITKPPAYRRLYSGFLRLVRSRPADGIASQGQATKRTPKGVIQTQQKGCSGDDEPPTAA